jgi:RNA polymerase sigma-70 factor (ECF subfamily)
MPFDSPSAVRSHVGLDQHRPTAPAPAAALDAEADLVARLKNGDGDAYETLVRTHGPRMLAVARRYLPQEADAEDALQDAFVNVARAIGNFSGDSRLGTWLHRIVVNCALTRIRSRSRRSEEPTDKIEAIQAAAPQRSWSHGASSILEREDLRETVRSCVDRLPEAVRAVLRLRDVEGMEMREVCRLLDIGLSTAKVRLHRARHALRAILEQTLGEVGS